MQAHKLRLTEVELLPGQPVALEIWVDTNGIYTRIRFAERGSDGRWRVCTVLCAPLTPISAAGRFRTSAVNMRRWSVAVTAIGNGEATCRRSSPLVIVPM